MASITLKNIPDQLHAAYKRRAHANARSLQLEIIHTLSRNANLPPETGAADIEAVAGMLKPGRKGVTVEDMREGVDQHFRKTWK